MGLLIIIGLLYAEHRKIAFRGAALEDTHACTRDIPLEQRRRILENDQIDTIDGEMEGRTDASQ